MNKIIEIPEGYKARIEGNKVVLEPKENEDERIRKEPQEIPLMNGDTDLYFDVWKEQFQGNPTKRQCFEEGIRYSERRQKEVKPAEWSEEDEKMLRTIISDGSRGVELDSKQISWLKSLRPQPRQPLAISIMLYLDKNRPIGTMCLSNGECEDIEDAFKKEDWAKLIRYIQKYQAHWKPTDEQLQALWRAVEYLDESDNEDFDIIESLYNELTKLI